MNLLTEITRRLDNMIRLGTIAEVDHGDPAQQKMPCCRVKTGNITTGWLPWLNLRAGETRTWEPVTVGEQCVVFSPSGEPTQGIVLVGIYSSNHPAPSNSPDKHSTTYPDGAVIEYDHAAHHLLAILPAEGTTELESLGGISIKGPITHEGDYTQTGNQNVTGKVTVSVDVVAAGVSLVNHKHTGVTQGSAQTGTPV
ncbi:phage baseplate assembly protein V [Pseudomonas sp. M30-35]|uniref:phage baseplate assembly protein V n=1 Tax=Pseudomonas sp. M30-35 TaxID=1981174 RepID=UPI000B3C0C0C|nr:phage baseplate assembly protein V [Pseudomonas sp. M30-35]ARU88288.1 baseplate assembly protein [Pseudomonas sp. M30-35]